MMNKIFSQPVINAFIFFILFTTLVSSINAESSLYAKTTSYALSGDTYVHIGLYEDFRIFTDLSVEHFGDQTIVDYNNQVIFENEGRCEYLLYPYFFILVNYYDVFEVITLSPWSFDGIDALVNVNKQYIQFHE